MYGPTTAPSFIQMQIPPQAQQNSNFLNMSYQQPNSLVSQNNNPLLISNNSTQHVTQPYFHPAPQQIHLNNNFQQYQQQPYQNKNLMQQNFTMLGQQQQINGQQTPLQQQPLQQQQFQQQMNPTDINQHGFNNQINGGQNGNLLLSDQTNSNILNNNNNQVNNKNNLQQQNMLINNNITNLQQPLQQQLNQSNNSSFLNKQQTIQNISQFDQNTSNLKEDSDAKNSIYDKDTNDDSNATYEIIAFSNKWINRYLKNPKIRSILQVPVKPNEQDTLHYCDIFELKDCYIDYEFELVQYNPLKTKEGEEPTQTSSNENAIFLNRNKYLLQYILNFLTDENLNLLNLPEELKNQIVKIVNFIQQECGYNKKKKSFRFTLMSHCHYHLLFLKINQKNLREMMKREQDIDLHNRCFDLNLEDLRNYYKLKENQEDQNTKITDTQHQQLQKVQYINFVKMCINKLINYHVKDHILECAKTLTVKNQDKEYEERAFNKIDSMNEGNYMNRF